MAIGLVGLGRNQGILFASHVHVDISLTSFRWRQGGIIRQATRKALIPGNHFKTAGMCKTSFSILFALQFLGCFIGFAQERVFYKQIDTSKLAMEFYFPKTIETNKKYPAMIFFFGGGWTSGSTKQFEPQARYFSERGMICILADYRVKNRQQSTPIESLKDAKSAIRFVRQNADRFHIDTGKIVAAGGSAGGQLAAATALTDSYNENTDNLTVSCKPNALVLYNPVIDNGPGGYGYERIGNDYKSFSPLHNIKQGAPPTIMFLGTDDNLIPVETARYFKVAMNKVKSRCDLFLYEGQAHGFFNYKNFEYYKKTVAETDLFLQSEGYLKKEPAVEIK
jgi:acetyl esterase/lipase